MKDLKNLGDDMAALIKDKIQDTVSEGVDPTLVEKHLSEIAEQMEGWDD